jgi:hypothetical protein
MIPETMATRTPAIPLAFRWVSPLAVGERVPTTGNTLIAAAGRGF